MLHDQVSLYHQLHIDTVKDLVKDIKEEAPTIGGVKMKKLGSGKPGSYTNLVKKHLGARAASKLDKSDGNKLIAKGKKTGNKDLVRKGSFIKNVIAKEEGGAGKEGTDPLKDKYKKETPGQ